MLVNFNVCREWISTDNPSVFHILCNSVHTTLCQIVTLSAYSYIPKRCFYYCIKCISLACLCWIGWKCEARAVSQAGEVVRDLTGSPKGFDESLHFLCLSLHTNMSLELSQGFIELHAWKIHLVHDAAVKGETKRGQSSERQRKGVSVFVMLLRRCVQADAVWVCERDTLWKGITADGKYYSHTSYTKLLTWKMLYYIILCMLELLFIFVHPISSLVCIHLWVCLDSLS